MPYKVTTELLETLKPDAPLFKIMLLLVDEGEKKSPVV